MDREEPVRQNAPMILMLQVSLTLFNLQEVADRNLVDGLWNHRHREILRQMYVTAQELTDVGMAPATPEGIAVVDHLHDVFMQLMRELTE